MAEDNFSKKEGLNSIPNSRQSIFDSQRKFNATEGHPYYGKLKMSPLHSFVRRMKRTLTKRGLIGSMHHSVIRTFCYIQNLSPSMKHAKALKKKSRGKI